jgi:peptidoglycan hydrolase-like protein with peptidoglycan-binding domain
VLLVVLGGCGSGDGNGALTAAQTRVSAKEKALTEAKADGRLLRLERDLEQQTLKLAGFWDGPVDGEWTPALTQALNDFQTELGVKPTGTVDAAILAALESAIAEAEPTPSTTTPSLSSASDPSSPTASSST